MKFTDAIYEATKTAMTRDPSVFIMGLGCSYKNGVDGTMGDLKELFPDRVLDTPVSEATVTGAAVGAAITGMRPIVHHGRVEFALFAADQIITQASKWNNMFGGNNPVPAVFRIGIGRQWGNGPQHSQTLVGLFGGCPGLRVVVPSSPNSAYGLMLAAIQSDYPVVFLEPQWVLSNTGPVSVDGYIPNLGSSRFIVRHERPDVTLVSYGDGLVESWRASKLLEMAGVKADIIDLVSLNPIDYNEVYNSTRRSKALVCVEMTSHAFGVGSEIISKVAQQNDIKHKVAPIHIACPHTPCPTAPNLMKLYYPNRYTIASRVLSHLGNSPSFMKDITMEEVLNRPTEELPF